MAVFIINEWIWADSSGENGREGQRRVLEIMTWLIESDHKIVIIEGSAFDQKAWALCKRTETVPVSLAKTFVTNIRQNSDRCMLLKPEEVSPVPEELSAAVKPDDHYLVRAQLSVAGSILISTDQPLRDVLTQVGLPCLSRDEFLVDYVRREH